MSTRYSIDPIHTMGLPFLGDDLIDEEVAGQPCVGTIQIAGPPVGMLRMPYQGASTMTIISCKNTTATDRDFLSFGPGDQITIGNTAPDLKLSPEVSDRTFLWVGAGDAWTIGG